MAIRARLSACLLLAIAFAGVGAARAADDAAARKVGAILFDDKRLSADGTIACSSCHVPSRAFADGNAVARGVEGRKGTRNTPSLLSAGGHRVFLWDGRRATLEEQVLDPLTNPSEHGLASIEEAIRLIERIEGYREAFREAFPGTGISRDTLAVALASFVRSLAAGASRFDRFSGGEARALDAAEKRGLALFAGRGQCAGCHLVDGRAPGLTDDQFHALARGSRDRGARVAQAARRSMSTPESALGSLITSDSEVSGLGRFNVTRRPADVGKFRTPSLRNVALTAPYMHDGSVATLEEAVDLELYYRGAHQGRPIVFTPGEKADLVAFLRSLTDNP